MKWRDHVQASQERSYEDLLRQHLRRKMRSSSTISSLRMRPQSALRSTESLGQLSAYSMPSLASAPNLRWIDPIAASKQELHLLEHSQRELDSGTRVQYKYPLGHPLGPPLGATPSAAELHQRRCAIQAAERTKALMDSMRGMHRKQPSNAAIYQASRTSAHQGSMSSTKSMSSMASLNESLSADSLLGAMQAAVAPEAQKISPAVPMLRAESTKRVVDRDAARKSAIVRAAIESVNSRFGNMMKAFQYVDLDRSGTLSKKEIARALDLWNVPIDHDKLDQLIDACDHDGDGDIDYKEFVDVLARDTVAPAAMGKRDMQAKEAFGVDDIEQMQQAVKNRPKFEGSKTVNHELQW